MRERLLWALNPSASGSVSIGQAVAPWSIGVVVSVLADLMVLEPAVVWAWAGAGAFTAYVIRLYFSSLSVSC